MDHTGKNNQVPEVKTFPVLTPLVKDQEEFSTFSKLSKKQIINQALNLHSKGNFIEAAKYYQYCIKKGFNDHRIFSNYGLILKEIGKLKEAKFLLLNAIELNPYSLDSHYNLGTILIDLVELEEAEKVFLNAIKLQPNYPYSYLSLGSLLFDLGRLQEAENVIKKAIELKSDLIKAHVKLGEILFEQDKTKEASIAEWNAIKLNPLFTFLKDYRDKARLINKTAFYIFNLTIFSHYKPIIEINPESFEILVPDNIEKAKLLIMREELNNKDIRIRYHSELLENKLLYEKLVSNLVHHTRDFIKIENSIQVKSSVPAIKMLGKKNINFMYTAGKNKSVFSYWNKYYDEILCFGPYHKEQFKRRHDLPIYQMGYPRFDKYFNPGFDINYLVKKFNCDPKKKTIVWLPTWTTLSSIDKYLEAISSLRSFHNTVVRPHPAMKKDDPDNYKKLLAAEFNYIDDNDGDNVELYALADLMIFDYGGSMFGSLYLNKNFAFLEMNLEAKNHIHLGKKSSEEYLKSFFPDRIASLETLKSICNYCLENPPSNSVTHSLRREFFNTNYQGNSAKRAYEILTQND